MRLLPDHQPHDLPHRERIDDRGRVPHTVVHRDPLAIGRDPELMRELSDGDLADHRVLLARLSVQDPDLVGAFGCDEDAELRIARRDR